MKRQTLVAILVTLAVVLLVLPLGMVAMMGMGFCCGGMMEGSTMGMMNGMGMGGLGIVWMLLALLVVIALIVLIVRGVTRT